MCNHISVLLAVVNWVANATIFLSCKDLLVFSLFFRATNSTNL